ncbi:MAG TPA: YcnI family protein [Solirubrobacteraceae bacterium]|jgi:uncharacterized protein
MTAKTIAVLVAAVALISPAGALAHISIHPNTIPAGAFATIDVRVPGEQQGAFVKKLDMLFPAGFTAVGYQDVPGWSVRVIERKLATPIVQSGESIHAEISQVVWTWTGPLGKVADGQFVQLPLSVAIPTDASGKALEFRTVQSYSNGQTVHWIDPSLQAEHPSPRINVTAKGGVIEDVAGDEAGPQAGQPLAGVGAAAPASAVAKSGGGSSKGLALAALIVGALGLLTGSGALLALRRRQRSAL